MSQPLHLKIDRPGQRLDQWLAQAVPQLSRSQVQKLIRQEQVLLNGRPVRSSVVGQPGQFVTLYLPAPEPALPQPEALSLEVVYEDDDLVVINKPPGLVVHPALGHTGGTLVNALLARYADLAEMTAPQTSGFFETAEVLAANRPGIVHRLDRDTSGLMVVARTPAALHHLQRQFKTHRVKKTYLALVFGCPPAPEGLIDVPLGRDLHHRQKFAPRADGKPARTHYRLIQNVGQYSLLTIGLETGRTHQIRVHLAWLKCPVVGDTVYGRPKNSLGLTRQFLHAWQLAFQHPRTGQMLQLEAPLPSDLLDILKKINIVLR
jgi:23S rRNA pseudouridine1911/1915/1917 synthase